MFPDRLNPDRWEQGSEFHLMDYRSQYVPKNPWDNDCLFMGAGRDAICILLRHGIHQRGWLRFWIPGYLCPEIAQSIVSTGITVMVYDNNPFRVFDEWDRLTLQKGDAIFVVNYFGIGVQPDLTNINSNKVEIVEDHTHDPWSDWSWSSKADWCIASLRKTLPIPDGGVLWSPRSHTLPSTVVFTTERKIASLEKLAGMVLKKYYLDGLHVQKQIFRNLSISGESGIGSGSISAMSPWSREMIKTFPVKNWRNIRIRNYLILVKQLKKCAWLRVSGEIPPGTCPIMVPIIFDSVARRNYVGQRLIENSIYPAILWDLTNHVIDGISIQNIDLSQRILCIHCDMRYDEETMNRTANLIILFAEQFCDTG